MMSGSSTGEQLVAPSTKIISDEVSNTLVIFASPADYSVILGAIKQIDSVPRQVMIEAVR
jgi:general secretion pathway protein D